MYAQRTVSTIQGICVCFSSNSSDIVIVPYVILEGQISKYNNALRWPQALVILFYDSRASHPVVHPLCGNDLFFLALNYSDSANLF